MTSRDEAKRELKKTFGSLAIQIVVPTIGASLYFLFAPLYIDIQSVPAKIIGTLWIAGFGYISYKLSKVYRDSYNDESV